MPYSCPENNTFIHGHKPLAPFSPASCQFPFTACYGPMSASSSVWDQMDLQQRTRLLTQLMTEQVEQNQVLSRPSCQNQTLSRPSCQYMDRQTQGMPQFPTSCSVPSLTLSGPSLTVPGGLGFWNLPPSIFHTLSLKITSCSDIQWHLRQLQFILYECCLEFHHKVVQRVCILIFISGVLLCCILWNNGAIL